MVRIGDIIDSRYKILREIGRGGTSCVFQARNIRLNNYVAVKEVYKNDTTINGVKTAGLIAETRILTKLRHPGLPVIMDVIETYNSYLIIMEYIEGTSLDKVIDKYGAQPQDTVVRWGIQLCDVLEYLHSQTPSIIYRDMKPANIMLKPDGSIVLVDFGMAREYKPDSNYDTGIYGTHGYAAPEQFAGISQTDARTDIYSLGVTLYNLATGVDPCMPAHDLEHASNDNPLLSKQLEHIIATCVKIKPEGRYQSAGQLRDALIRVQNGETDFYEADEAPKKNNGYIWILIAVPIVVILILVVANAALSKSKGYKGYDYDDNPEDETTQYVGTTSEPETTIDTETGEMGETTNNDPEMTDSIQADGEEQYIEGNESNMDIFGQEVDIQSEDDRCYLEFTPQESGVYRFYSASDEIIPVAWLIDSNGNKITEDNTYGIYTEFDITEWLDAGETYQLETTLYDLDEDVPGTGSYMVYVELVK